MLATAALAFAIACDRPAGEGSAADQQEERPDYPQAAPTSEAQQQQAQEQQARPAQPTTAMPQPGSPGDNVRGAGELRVADITRDPGARVDQDVTVVGEVEDMLGAHAFKLNDEAPLAAGADDDIVVLGKQQAPWTIDQTKGDARVRVSGKLMRVPAAGLERELGWDFDDKLQSAMQDEQVVLIAQRVERLEGGAQQREAQRDVTGRTAGEREPVRGTQQGEPAQPEGMQPAEPAQP